jgi:hypothetical protein
VTVVGACGALLAVAGWLTGAASLPFWDRALEVRRGDEGENIRFTLSWVCCIVACAVSCVVAHENQPWYTHIR